MFLVLALHPMLAFLNAHGVAANNGLVGLSEAIILAFACFAIGSSFRTSTMLILAMLLCYAFLRIMFVQTLDIKTVRDFLIPIIFYELGRTQGSQERGDWIMKRAVLIVFAVGIWELLQPEGFSQVFQVLRYYIARGATSSEILEYSGNVLLNVNGIRPVGIGRTFFPQLLGSHRVSSVFLEPVSLGNFAAVSFCWFLFTGSVRRNLIWLTLSLALVVLADSRFGGLLCMITGLVYFALRRTPNLALLVAPAIALMGLIQIGLLEIRGDNFAGRLSYSGRSLLDLDVMQILGVSPNGVYSFDSGYSYIFLNFGFIGAALIWVYFAAYCANQPRQRGFKIFLVCHFTLLMCISNSVFSMKSAAFLWMLLGSLGASARLASHPSSGFPLRPSRPVVLNRVIS